MTNNILTGGVSVSHLQTLLMSAGYDLIADNIPGPKTIHALRAFQRDMDLVVDGIAGPRTLAALHGNKSAWSLQQTDIEQAAEYLQVPLAAVHAVAEIESKGNGFIQTNMPALLFERHIMLRRLQVNQVDPRPHLDIAPDLVNQQPGGYRGGIHEHSRLTQAKAIHEDAAIESASWGRFQIMGFHWESLGYASAASFEFAMRYSEAQHLEAFVRFIEVDPKLHNALRHQDWARFARIYNGPDYARNQYDTRLADAFERFTGNA